MIKKLVNTVRALCIVILLGISHDIGAQTQLGVPTQSNDAVQENVESTPRQTLREMLNIMSGSSAVPLAEFFDTRQTAKLRFINEQVVIARFSELLDTHGGLQPLGLVSDKPEGSMDPAIGLNKEKIGTFRFENKQFDIILEKVTINPTTSQWLVSQDTIVAISKVVDDLSTSKINRLLPDALEVPTWRGASIGQWVSAIILAVLAAMIGWLIVISSQFVTSRFLAKKPDSKLAQVSTALSLPLGLTAAAFGFLFAERYLEFSILIRQDFSFIIITVLWIALFVFIWSLIDKLSTRGEQILRDKNRVGSLSIVLFFRASAKACLFIFALILVLSTNGVDVTTGLAALGIGGIALALGAQKAIENLVGSVIIVADQPLRVGDFCQIGDVLGTIENIGLRSTRIRTLADTMVTIPNGLLSSERIENYTMRKKFLLRTVLNLRYETSPDALKTVLSLLREHLDTSVHVYKDGQRVRFIGYGGSSLDVEIFAYVKAPNYDTFLARQEELLIDMYEVINQYSGFAFPSQTVYMAKDEGVNQLPSVD